MKKEYIKPEMDYLLFISSDVIATDEYSDIVDGSFMEGDNPWLPKP